MCWKNQFRYFWTRVWSYLNQPLFDPKQSVILDPFSFNYYNDVHFLERCWELDCSAETYH